MQGEAVVVVEVVVVKVVVEPSQAEGASVGYKENWNFQFFQNTARFLPSMHQLFFWVM